MRPIQCPGRSAHKKVTNRLRSFEPIRLSSTVWSFHQQKKKTGFSANGPATLADFGRASGQAAPSRSPSISSKTEAYGCCLLRAGMLAVAFPVKLRKFSETSSADTSTRLGCETLRVRKFSIAKRRSVRRLISDRRSCERKKPPTEIQFVMQRPRRLELVIRSVILTQVLATEKSTNNLGNFIAHVHRILSLHNLGIGATALACELIL